MKILDDLANKIRIHAIKMTSKANSSHIGSILSISDILAVLYGRILKKDPQNPTLSDRDRFILSKGHAGAGLYAALGETKFFPISDLETYYQNGSVFSGHVSHIGVQGVELSTGSLGHGLGIGVGMALAGKKKTKDHKIYVLMSDGECDEGSNWEAIMFAAHHSLDNLVAIIDYNKIQSLSSTYETLNLEPFVDKWRAFGWKVLEVDGHDTTKLSECFFKLDNYNDKPKVLICHTIKGKGVSFMENSVLWHYRSPQDKEFKEAIKELEG